MNNVSAVLAIVVIWMVIGYIFTHIPLAWVTDGVTLAFAMAGLASTGLVLVSNDKKGN